MPDLTKYLQRVSHLLRQGTPVNDVALFLPNSDAWANLGRDFSLVAVIHPKVGRLVRAITDAGYDLDFFDDQLLARRGKISGSTLAFGDMHYRAVVLPGVERIPPATMKTLDKFARAGGIVIATRRLPDLAPGYKTPAADTQAVRDIVQRLFKDKNAAGIFIADESQLGAALAKRLPPDVAISPLATEIGVVHRHTAAGDIYFVANTSNELKNVQATFRVTGMQPEIWNAMDGSASSMTITGQSAGTTTIKLSLAPYASTIVAFTKRSLPAQTAPVVVVAPPPVDLSTGWTVRFGKAGQPVALDRLASWTTLTNEINFSGVATYEKTITVAPEMLQQGLSVTFDFGPAAPVPEPPVPEQHIGPSYCANLDAPVREAAILYLNGRRAGAVWCPPYAIDVTGKLKAGENKIRIEAANLAVNYMAGIKLPNYNYPELTRQFGNRFQPQNLDLIRPLPSGLLGPVRLVAAAAR